MPNKHLISCIVLMAFIFNPGCEAWVALTARYHEPRTETPESILRFAKKSHFDNYPILRYDTSYLQSEYFGLPDFPGYNSSGHFLSLRDTLPGCPDKKQEYIAMKYILQHGDSHFILDTLTTRTGFTKDTNEMKKFSQKFLSTADLDTSLWEIQMDTLDTHLDHIAPYLRTLDNKEVSIKKMYSDYLMLSTFMLAGTIKVQNYLLRGKIKDIKKLNKEFGNRIQLVMINMDQIK